MDRLLSSSESFFANLCERGTNTVGVVWAVQGPVTKKLLTSALDYLASVHPVLRSGIVKTNNKEDIYERAWKPLAGREWYALQTVVPLLENSLFAADAISQQSLEILESTFLEPYVAGHDAKIGSPLARIWLVQDETNTDEYKKSEIVFAVSHGMMDGRSTALFVDQLLQVMACLLEGNQPNLPIQKETKLPDEQTMSGKDDEMRNEKFTVLPIAKSVTARERTWGVANYKIDKKNPLMPKLKKLCKEHSVSINAALMASFVEAIDIQCKKVKFENSPFYHVVSAVDLGGEISGQQLCSSHVLAVMSEIEKTSDKTFWDIAKLYQQKLVKSVEEKKWLATVPSNTQFFEPDFIDKTMLDTQGRLNTFTLSNMGDLNRFFGKIDKDVWSHGPFQITDVCISPNQQIMGSCFAVLVAFFNGNLSLSLGFPTPTYDRKFMDELAKTAIQVLEKQ